MPAPLTTTVGIQPDSGHAHGMGREPSIPPELRRRPFTLAEARAVGVSRKYLTGSSWRRISSELYCWTGWTEDPLGLLTAWARRIPSDAVFAGGSAAWLWRVGFNPVKPVEIVVPLTSGTRSRPGLNVRRATLAPVDVTETRDFQVTTLHRTLLDLSSRRAEIDALISIDMAIRSEQTSASALASYAEAMRGRPGAWRLQKLAAVSAPAESPMETRLRWLLLEAGLPQPRVQVDLRDDDERFICRADLFYPSAGLVIEYDGANHRDRLVEDDRRQNAILDAGFKLLRFTASDLDRAPMVASLVSSALAKRTFDANRPSRG